MLTAELLLLSALVAGQPSETLFRQRIAPLLEQRCVGCHNADKTSGGLDLSTSASFRKGSDSGPIMAREAEKSLLLQVVSGPKPRMPRAGEKLSAAEVALLRKWIESGAAWPEGLTLRPRALVSEPVWWSLRPLSRPTVPTVANRSWVRTPIDAFVLARLEANRLRPAPEADRRTLLRRLCFDLTGLPPTPEQMSAFLADPRPDAYERLVDSLLGSPAYGERWGRHWLDVARYADTHGYDKDKRRDHAWLYRDWVIDSLNADQDYRSFIRDQLAGDVLRPDDPRGVMATGFVVAGPWDFVGHVELREGTVDKEKTRLLDRDEMVSSILGPLNSLTVGCARCHDHKFDPIPMRDYYRLQAVFAGVERANRVVPGLPNNERNELAQQLAQLRQQLAEVQQQIASVRNAELERLTAREAELRRQLARLTPEKGPASPTNGYHSQIAATPDVVKWVQVDLGAEVAVAAVHLIPARPIDFPDTPGFGFPVRWRLEVSNDPEFRTSRLLVDHTQADQPNPGDVPVVVAAHGKRGRYVRMTATRLWKRLEDYCFALAELQVDVAGQNLAAGKPVTSLDTIEAGRWSRRHLVDGHDSRQRLPQADSPAAKAYRQRGQLAGELQQLTQQRAAILQRLVPHLLQQRRQLQTQIQQTEQRLQKLPIGPQVYAVSSIPPRPIWVLHRGDVENRRAKVTPGTLSCLESLPADLPVADNEPEGKRRLALANWITDDRNVLTWRSIVNRVWHYHFGKGLVDTPNDFGRMGGLPSHPELLDWLATEFRQSPSLKRLHRLIVLSSVYRQSSRHNEAAARIDSDNRLLWRMNRLRLDAETLRDSVLAVSGQLDRRQGGPGYDLFRFKDDHSPVYDHFDVNRIHDPATYRRTVYRFIVRSVPNPFLDCLDCADPNQPTPVRNTTLTALQALALLNNPFMVRQSLHLAERLAGAGDEPAQVRQAYALLFTRSPSEEELRSVSEHIRRHGLAATCRILLNTNEFLFVD